MTQKDFLLLNLRKLGDEMIKLLFLPHCLKSEYLERLKKEGKKRDYNIHVVGGSSAVKKILAECQKINKIVGIACEDEIRLAMDYTRDLRKKGVEIKAIRLLVDGCKDTEGNLEEAVNAL